jgi:hypothetical protein
MFCILTRSTHDKKFRLNRAIRLGVIVPLVSLGVIVPLVQE